MTSGRQGRGYTIGLWAEHPSGVARGPAILCHLACRSSNGHRIFPCVWRRAACECWILHARRELVSFGTVLRPPIGLLPCGRLHHRGRDQRDHGRWLRGRRWHRGGTCGKLVVAEGPYATGGSTGSPILAVSPHCQRLHRQPTATLDGYDGYLGDLVRRCQSDSTDNKDGRRSAASWTTSSR